MSRYGQAHSGVFPKGTLGQPAAAPPIPESMTTEPGGLSAPPHVVPPLVPATHEQQATGAEPLFAHIPSLGHVPAAAYLAGAALVFWFVSNGTARMRSGV